MKSCNRCEEQKDISEFYKNSHASDGLKSICKSCTAKKAKEYYDNNPDKIIVAPKQWFVNKTSDQISILPKKWLQI